MNKGSDYVRINAKITTLADMLLDRMSMLLGVDRQDVMEIALRELATKYGVDWVSMVASIEDGHEKS